jgi:hypothetical protein
MNRLLTAAFNIGCAMVMSAAISTPASAIVYWCKDGTQVSNSKACKSHNGCCQTMRATPTGASTMGAGTKNSSIFDRWGNEKSKK